ncbi:MAG: rod shape-determining protein MreD [Gammaproteobacteria bacterium]|jgi:rod shape-determining protein MreD|nr:rod shape-determining protein MreD [Gammaproteobacteria bacterium]MBT6042798.1 rod shape-determining protein MreD [Gammaproteobacteria bacterium]
MAQKFNKHHGGWVITVSFVLAALFTVLPLPEWLEAYRPEWVALVVIYWVIALPDRIGLLTAWIVGFFVDVLEGSLLGLNALALALVAYLALSLYQRMRMFTAIQQSSTILILVGIHQLMSFWVLTANSQNTAPNLIFMISALSSAIIWPFIFFGLRYIRRTFNVV